MLLSGLLPRGMYGADGWPDAMIIDAPMLVTKLNARRASLCHWECRSMMRPMEPVLLRGRLAASLCSGGTIAVRGWFLLTPRLLSLAGTTARWQ